MGAENFNFSFNYPQKKICQQFSDGQRCRAGNCFLLLPRRCWKTRHESV